MSQSSSASLLACPENQRIVNHLAKVAHRCLVTKREGYRFSILKAIKSVKLFPLPLESLEECLMLDGVGPSIAAEMMKAVVVADENTPSNRTTTTTTTTTKTTKKRTEHPSKGTQSPCAIKSPLLKRPCPVVPSAVGGSRGPPMVCVDLTEVDEEEDGEGTGRDCDDHAFEYGEVLDEDDWGCVMSSHAKNDPTSSSSARHRANNLDRPYQHTLSALNDDDNDDNDSYEGKAEDEDDVVPSLSQLHITNTSKSSSRPSGSSNNNSHRIHPRPPPLAAPAALPPPAVAHSDSNQRARSQPSIPAPDRPTPSNNTTRTTTTNNNINTTADNNGTTPGLGCSDSSSSSCAVVRRLPGGERAWEAVLLVDTREKDHLMVQSMMIERGVPCEVR